MIVLDRRGHSSQELRKQVLSFAWVTWLTALLGCGGGGSSPQVIAPIAAIEPESEEVKSFVVDIQTVAFSADFTHNNQLHQSELSNGQFFLRNLEDDELTLIGTLYDQSNEMTLVRGDYQLEYYYQFGEGVPANYPYVISDDFVVDQSISETIDIESVSVGMEVQMNGNAFPVDNSNAANIYLKPVDGGEEIFLGSTSLEQQYTDIVPGNYFIVYRYVSGDEIPINKEFQFPDAREISSASTLEIDIETADARVRFDSEDFRKIFNFENVANFYLTKKALEQPTLIGSSNDEIVSVKVIASDYNLVYDYQYGESIPINQLTNLEQVSVMEDGAVIQPTVEIVTLNGEFFHNGEVPSTSLYETARLELVDSLTLNRYLVGHTRELFYEELNVLPGEYHVVYSHSEGDALPQNIGATIIPTFELTVSEQLDIDIASVSVTPIFSHNGEAFSSSLYASARIYLTLDKLKFIWVGYTNSDPLPVVVLPGDYSVVYRVQESQDMAINENYILSTPATVLESMELNLDFESTQIQIETLVNGVIAPNSLYDMGKLWLGNDSELFEIGFTREPIQLRVLNGTYDVYYQKAETQGVMPANSMRKITSIVVD